jgi:hypothetical protein
VCAEGTTICSGGSLICEPNIAPSPEVCDGLDNNCNGEVDEGCPCLINLDCDSKYYCSKLESHCLDSGICTKRPDSCTAVYIPVCGCDGVTYGNACEAAWAGVSIAHQGTCNEDLCFDLLDNDNDGLTDCADPDCDGVTDGSCLTGEPGICSEGILTCTGGAEVCLPTHQGQEGLFANNISGEDLIYGYYDVRSNVDNYYDMVNMATTTSADYNCFDGVDNDCDGLTDCADPGCDGVTDGSCISGLPGICSEGTKICTNNTEICEPNILPGEYPEGVLAKNISGEALIYGYYDVRSNVDNYYDMVNMAITTSADYTCFDGDDNDCDGLTDCEDPGCDGATDDWCDTGLSGICTDGIRTCIEGGEECIPVDSGCVGLTCIFDDFENGFPDDWSVIDNAGTGAVWRFNDPESRGNLTGGTGNFAIADSDYEGTIDMDTELRTPSLDMKDMIAVFLSFKTDFKYYSSGASEIADVDVSVNGEVGPWTNVWRKTNDLRGPRTETVELIGGGR